MGVRTNHGAKLREELVQYMYDFQKANKYLPTLAQLARKMVMHRTAVIWHLSILRDEGRVNYIDQHIAQSLTLTGVRIPFGAPEKVAK